MSADMPRRFALWLIVMLFAVNLGGCADDPSETESIPYNGKEWGELAAQPAVSANSVARGNSITVGLDTKRTTSAFVSLLDHQGTYGKCAETFIGLPPDRAELGAFDAVLDTSDCSEGASYTIVITLNRVIRQTKQCSSPYERQYITTYQNPRNETDYQWSVYLFWTEYIRDGVCQLHEGSVVDFSSSNIRAHAVTVTAP